MRALRSRRPDRPGSAKKGETPGRPDARCFFRAGGLAALLSLAALLGAQPAAAQRPYAVDDRATCDGSPRLPIETAPGMCAGLVSGPQADGPRMPRVLLPLSDDEWLLTDLGAWDAGRGAVWRLDVQAGRPARWTRVAGGQDMPHPIARGPDGAIYVGEMGRISRLDPASGRLTPVVEGLPDNRLHEDRHPLSMFVFDGNGDLIVNVGAPSDQCRPPLGGRPERCHESEGPRDTAGLRRYAYAGDGRWNSRYTVLAQGLRNSLALVRHRSGTLVQLENSIDFPDANRPFEELNVIEQGRHYGWPYCTDMGTPTPAWRASAAGRACRTNAYAAPALLLPPHSAPLSAIYYDGRAFPALRGRLLVALHGYREAGARIVAYRVDDRGVPPARPGARYAAYSNARRAYPAGAPAAEADVLTPGWNGVRGRRPVGTPVGLAVAPDGSIWVAEDKNRTVIRLAPDRP